MDDRTLEQALRNAERLRKELPALVQPSASDYDIVLLADELTRLRRKLAEARLDGEYYHSLCGLIRANPNALAGELLKWFKGESAINAATVSK